jgi:penicillin-binding protein 1C
MPYRLLDAEASEPAVGPGIQMAADPGAAYIIADILSDNSARTLAFGAESPLRFAFPVACKTGTSSDFRDNWAFGFTPEFTVGVWVGNFDGSPMRDVSGVTGAGPILHSLFEHLRERYGTTWYKMPAAVHEDWVDAMTGKRLADAKTKSQRPPERVREKFIGSSLPPFESPDDYDSAGRVRLGAEYGGWLDSQDNWLGDRAVLAGGESSLHILFPPPGTILYLDPDLPQGGRRLALKAAGTGLAQWSSDSLECRHEGGQCIALLREGRHRLAVHDPVTGLQAETWINVLAR